MQTLLVVKIGGNVIDDPALFSEFMKDFSALPEPKVLVHGGGKLTTQLAEKLGVKQTMTDGRRITDAETLNIATMVYAGLINKRLVAGLQAHACMAMGFSGADANLITASKRPVRDVDFGFVGDISEGGVNSHQLSFFLNAGITAVICAITHDGNGNLLNTNADTLVTEIAIALHNSFDVQLIYCFEKKGVLSDVANEDAYLQQLDIEEYIQLKLVGKVSEGMIPKLDNAFRAFDAGVKRVAVCHARALKNHVDLKEATQLTLA